VLYRRNYYDSKFILSFKKSPFLALIKFKPTFFTGSLAVCLSTPVHGEAGNWGVEEIPLDEPGQFGSKVQILTQNFRPPEFRCAKRYKKCQYG